MSAAGRVDFTGAVADAIFQLRAWQRDHGDDPGSKEAIAKLRATSAAVIELVEAHREALDFIGGLGSDLDPPNGGYRKWRAALARIGGAA